jgi:hypothetical protein
MTSMSRGSIWMAAFTLVVVAAIGGYLGYNKATGAPGGDIGAGAATPIAAKTASPIPDGAAAPVPDEAFIRKIAQDEIQNTLHPKKPAVAKAADDSSDDDNSDDHGPVPAAPSAGAVTPMPATPVAPITPPPAPASPPPPAGLY